MCVVGKLGGQRGREVAETICDDFFFSLFFLVFFSSFFLFVSSKVVRYANVSCQICLLSRGLTFFLQHCHWRAGAGGIV